MGRNESLIRTTHTGSLPRSERLRNAMFEHQQGTRPASELEGLITDEVALIVARQAEIGLSAVNDGEVTKPGFANYIRERLTGMGGQAEPWMFHDLTEDPELTDSLVNLEGFQHVHMPACTGELQYVGHDAVRRDIDLLKDAAQRNGVDEVFMSSVSPGTLAYHASNSYYSTYEEYVWAAAEAMREEYEAIAGAGVLVQLDSPDLPSSHPAHSIWWGAQVVDKLGGHGKLVELNIDALNHATRNIPPEQMRMHLCWGNYEGPHDRDMPLADIIAPVLKRARPRAVLFEAANPRHEHEWEVFESVEVPSDKLIVPGVIDTLTNFVEHPRLVAQRIERFARLVGPDRVMAGTDCGFDTFVGTSRVAPGVTWKKLKSLVEGAKLASERLGTVRRR